MRIKTFTAIAAVAISGLFASSAIGAGQAETTVTIKGSNGDYYGYVKSEDKQNCANGRKVKVYKMLGSSPNPSQDLKIGSDTASPNGDGYMWSIGNSGYKSGKFYAKAGATTYCQSDRSNVIQG